MNLRSAGLRVFPWLAFAIQKHSDTLGRNSEIMPQQFSGRVALVTGRASGLGRASAMAQAVIYLFSDAAAFITGHSLVMDAGIMAE